MTSPSSCIWCAQPVSRANIEHILPDALGCPPDFVLKDCVCMACNNGFGHIDNALLGQFEIIAFMKGVRRKRGKKPSINNWAPIKGRYTDSGPEIHLNGGSKVAEAFGVKLPAGSNKNGISNISMKPRIPGEQSKVSFEQEFGRDPKFVRAVYKVAFNTLAFFDGPQEARASKYDGVRAFVRAGIGKHRLLIMGNGDQQSHSFCPPITLAGHQYPILEMSIFGVSLAADLDPAQKGLAEMIHQLQTRKITNWTVLPPESTDRSSIRLCGAQKT